MDGMGLAAAMQARLGDHAPPVILLVLRGDLREPAGLKIAARLAKPVKPRELHQALAQALGRSAAAPADPSRYSSPFDRDLSGRNPMRVLVAEDNYVNRKLLFLMLAKFGYQADAATNGVEALECLARHPYDLVVMDMQMPEMDGLEATRRLRSQVPQTEAPYILALTANARQEDHHACLEAGMHDSEQAGAPRRPQGRPRARAPLVADRWPPGPRPSPFDPIVVKRCGLARFTSTPTPRATPLRGAG
jgi:CheY-like chemotaxis protein